jgi:outer membrane protein OmpA-like peptidoglycan-associated protein
MNLYIFRYLLWAVLMVSNLQSLFAQADTTANVAISRFDKVVSDARVNRTFIDDRNVIWLASNRGLIETVSDGSRTVRHLEDLEILDVVADKKGNVYAASQYAIHHINTKNTYTLPKSVTITDITYLDGKVWVGTESGVYELNTATGKYKSYNETNTPMISTMINFIHADKNKVVWVGTDKGYLRVEDDKWKLYDKKLKMLATAENNEGQWIINNEDMVLINPFNRIFPVKVDENQYKGKINNFVIDSKGRIYIASDILVRYDPYKETNQNYYADAASLSKAALSLGCDKNDNVWIGTDGAGFYKLQFGDLVAEQMGATCLIESNILCPGGKNGAIRLSINGGQKPYAYKWSDEKLSGTSASNLAAGEYSVTVTDKIQNTAVATITLSDPTPINIELVSSNRVTTPENPDGSIEVKVSGGAGNYSYSWSNGTTAQNATKLNSGPYALNVRDKNGCQSTATFHVKKEKYIPDLEMGKITVGQKLRINELNFDADSSNITRSNYEILDEVYEFLTANPQVSVEIGGHTNTIPPHEYCDKLSSARAKNVAKYLSDRGIDSKRVKYKGYGKREPLTDATSTAGRQRNQRVEVKILTI